MNKNKGNQLFSNYKFSVNASKRIVIMQWRSVEVMRES